MVTQRGEGAQENGRPSDAALRAKMASMTYSFAQQLPIAPRRVPPKPPPAPGAPLPPSAPPPTAPSADPNFPLLTPQPPAVCAEHPSSRTPGTNTPGSSSRDPSPASRWGAGTRKAATAAEVVAARRVEPEAHSAQDEAATKERAELELYSKLVPTASAVPRNPGRTLGHGGLRSTGSVAAQHRAVARSKSPPIVSGQPPQPLPRKDAPTSRMRSLFSDASKPQLARKVAASSSRPRSVQFPLVHAQSLSSVGQSAPEEASNGGLRPSSQKVEPMVGNGQTEVAAKVMPSNDVRNDMDFSNSESRFSAVHPALSRLRDQSSSPEPFSNRSDSDHGRRLHEAFNDSARKIGGSRNSSFQSLRKSNASSVRRNSTSSLASLPSQLPNGNSGVPDGNGVPNGQADYVPANGFSNRSKGFSRSKVVNEKAESMASTFGKDSYKSNFSDRDLPRSTIAPTNSRAEALRNAIQSNSRKNGGASRSESRKAIGNQSGGRDGGAQATSSASASSGFSKTLTRRSVPALASAEPAKVPVPSAANVSQVRGVRDRDQPQRRPVSLSVPISSWPNDTAPAIPKNNFSQQVNVASPFSRPQRASVSADFTMSPRAQIDEDFPARKSTYVERPSRSMDIPQSIVRGSSPFNGLPAPAESSVHGPASLIVTGYNAHGLTHADIQRVLDTHEPKFVKSPILGEMRAPRARPWLVDEDSVNSAGAEALVNNLLEMDLNSVPPPRHQPNGIGRSQMGKTDPSVSMIDFMKNLHSQAASARAPTDAIEDAVLPPLPDSKDHGRFELYLRQNGYEPSDDEGESPVGTSSSSDVATSSAKSFTPFKYYSHFS